MPQPTAQLRVAIQALHEAIPLEPDPADKAVVAQCLQNLLRLQAKGLQEQQGGARGAVLNQLAPPVGAMG